MKPPLARGHAFIALAGRYSSKRRSDASRRLLGTPLSADQQKGAVDYLSAKFGPGGKTASAR